MNKIQRLSKIMTARGICSRREADKYIKCGFVSVNGKIVDQLGAKIDINSNIILSKEGLKEQGKLVTFLLNKPIGYVSGQPEKRYKPAISLINKSNHWSKGTPQKILNNSHLKGIAPAGRLDIDSCGLIVFTQDGRVAKHLIGENSEVEKEYLVRIKGTLSEKNLELLNHGLKLDGKELKMAKVKIKNKDQLQFILTEGKKRQIRRMCELVNLKVVGLKRVRIGKIKLGHLPEGNWRYLNKNEFF